MRSLLASLVGATVLALAAPAGAAIRHAEDPVDRGLPAYSDLTGLQARNGPHLLVVDLHLRTVRPDRTSAYAIVAPAPGTHGPTYTVGTQSSGHGHRRVLVRFGSEDSETAVRCHGLGVRLDTRRDVVHVVVPHHCLAGLTGIIGVSGLTEIPGDGTDQDDISSVVVPRG